MNDELITRLRAQGEQLAEALRWLHRDPYGPTSNDLTNTALAAHRERRTTPTKENTDG